MGLVLLAGLVAADSPGSHAEIEVLMAHVQARGATVEQIPVNTFKMLGADTIRSYRIDGATVTVYGFSSERGEDPRLHADPSHLWWGNQHALIDGAWSEANPLRYWVGDRVMVAHTGNGPVVEMLTKELGHPVATIDGTWRPGRVIDY